MSISHRLAVIAAEKKSPISYHWAEISDPPHVPTLTSRRFCSKSNHFIPGSDGRLLPKMKLIGYMYIDF